MEYKGNQTNEQTKTNFNFIILNIAISSNSMNMFLLYIQFKIKKKYVSNIVIYSPIINKCIGNSSKKFTIVGFIRSYSLCKKCI